MCECSLIDTVLKYVFFLLLFFFSFVVRIGVESGGIGIFVFESLLNRYVVLS